MDISVEHTLTNDIVRSVILFVCIKNIALGQVFIKKGNGSKRKRKNLVKRINHMNLLDIL